MGNKVIPLFIVTLMALEMAHSLMSNCPQSSRIASCSPKCVDSSNCPGAQVCCTNICSTKSCTDINQYLSSNKGGSGSSSGDNYKGSNSKGATGAYCGNVKCSPYEKCDFDRSTKRQQCVRT